MHIETVDGLSLGLVFFQALSALGARIPKSHARYPNTVRLFVKL